MVATKIAPRRAVAVGMVALLTLTLVPFATMPAQAQTVTDISMRYGVQKIFQTNFGSRETTFIDNGTGEIIVNVSVYNVGPDAVNVPVYYWLPDAPDKNGCVLASTGGVEARILQGTAGSPGIGWATFSLGSRLLPAGAWNVTLKAFPAEKPPQVTTECSPSTGKLLRPQTAENAASTCLPTNPATTCRIESDPANNMARAFFIKDHFLDLKVVDILWCKGDADPSVNPTCLTDMLEGEAWYNSTTEFGEAPLNTFFEVVVGFNGGKPYSWTDPFHYGGCNCSAADRDGFAYEVNITVTGPGVPIRNISEVANTSYGWDAETGTHRARSQNFLINDLAGRFNVTVKLDPKKDLRRHPSDTAADTSWVAPPRYHSNGVEIAFRDFTGNFTTGDFKTTRDNAYPYNGPFTIGGHVTFRNDGPAPLGTNDNIRITVFLDNETWTDSAGVVHYNSQFRRNLTGGYPPRSNFSNFTWEFAMDATSTLGSAQYLPPGSHTLYARIDANTNEAPCICKLESNESNNLFSVPIYVQDTTKPVFNASRPPKIVLATPQAQNAPSMNFYRPHEAFNVFADITDDDNNMQARINISLNSNASVYRVVNMSKTPTGEFYLAQVFDMKFYNFTAVPFNSTENWTVTVTANDSFGNNATSAGLPLRLKAWPIHNATGDYVIVIPETYPAANLSWNGVEDPKWRIRVEPNMTGLTSTSHPQHQQFNTSNLRLNVTVQATQKTFSAGGDAWDNLTPKNPTSTGLEPAAGCDPYPHPGQEVPGLPPELGPAPETCTDESLNNTFETGLLRTDDGMAPGLWNYSVLVTDIAGYVRAINGTLLLEDFKPEIKAANLTGVTEVVPPGSVRAQLAVTDDDNQVVGAYLNLTRIAPGDGLSVNITLTKRTEEEFEPGVTLFRYNETVDVKRGWDKAIGIGGTFNVSMHVVDNVGNWERTSIPGNLTIKDEEAPQLTGFGVTPSVAEIGENVTFWANASDATNVTIKIEVFKAAGSQELFVDPIVIAQPHGAGPWNYTTKLNFSLEAVHGYRITAIDSLNRASTPGTGTLTIRDNLGPKYDIRAPSVVIDNERYASGTPRIEVVVYDVEGVIGSSIEMRVAGNLVEVESAPAPGNLNGFLVSYQVPANRKFNHRDVVEVNLTARDNSAEELLSYRNFSFIVDDVAPTVRLVSITPSYRDQPAHQLNVSLNSRFTLAAEDLDGVGSNQVPVGGIRYRILGGGPGAAETVYASPFKINDAAGVYTGPRLYTVQYWAEDEVGNFNRQFNTTTVYVDDTPPALFQFFPQGRSINATFVDDRVGVNRSVVWYRTNDQPYIPLPLTERDAAWTATLPEGVKGDRISYYLQAWDRLDNTETFGNATNPYANFDVSNHEPKIRITAPADGSRVSRSFELTWEASDEDGDALVYTLYYRAPGKTNFVELAKLENTASRRYTIDSTRFPDGQYTFRIAAGDGGFVKLAESTVTIINSATAIGVVSVTGDAIPGGTMLVTAEVTKAEATVEARLYLDGELVGAYPMNDEGRDGDVTPNDHLYTARVPITQAGDYTVEIFTQYREDGELKESSIRPEDAVFSAKLTPGYILSEYGAVIALIGLLAAVGIGVAVFVVMRRR